MDREDKKPLAALLVAEKGPKPDDVDEMDNEAIMDSAADEMFEAMKAGDKETFKLALKDYIACIDY